MYKITCRTEIETARLGETLGKLLSPSDIICLDGDLGAGKTTLSQSIAKGLGIDEEITSPTFNLVNEYDYPVKLNHFDVYRIEHVEEMEHIGFDDYIFSDAISIIEWATLIEPLIPQGSIWVDIRIGETFTERVFTFKGNDEFIGKLKEVYPC